MPAPITVGATVYVGGKVVGYNEANALAPVTGGIPDVSVFPAPFTSNPAPNGAKAGAPGSWVPSYAAPPTTLGACPPLTGKPAWTTGQYNLLANGTSHVHWNGTAWATGDAA